MRVVELANRLGMGVGDTVELCRRAGIDVRLGIDDLRPDEINVLSTLFKLDLVSASVAAASQAPEPPVSETPAWARAQQEAPPPPPTPVLEMQPLPEEPVRSDPWGALASVVSALDEDADSGFDEFGEADESDSHSEFATLSGRRTARRRRLRTSRSSDEDGSDFTEVIDDRWVPMWIRRLIGVSAIGGLVVLGIVVIDGRTREAAQEAADREAAELVAGACFDYAGSAIVEASCIDTHDGQIVTIFEYPGDTTYVGDVELLADARVRCAEEPAVIEAHAAAPIPVRFEAQIPTRGGWDSGDRTTYCMLVGAGAVPLSGSLL